MLPAATPAAPWPPAAWPAAVWFVRCNTWLDDQRPLDLLADQCARVLAAARTDRDVITG